MVLGRPGNGEFKDHLLTAFTQMLKACSSGHLANEDL